LQILAILRSFYARGVEWGDHRLQHHQWHPGNSPGRLGILCGDCAFINLSAVAEILKEKAEDVVILCSGWKDRFSLEDTLFAGALAELLLKDGAFTTNCDSTVAASICGPLPKGI
jgi:hypothetical protein